MQWKKHTAFARVIISGTYFDDHDHTITCLYVGKPVVHVRSSIKPVPLVIAIPSFLFVSTIAMSRKAAKTDMEQAAIADQALVFFQALADSGQLQQVLDRIQPPGGGSSMTDASKRQGSDISELLEAEEFAMVSPGMSPIQSPERLIRAAQQQLPLNPGAKSKMTQGTMSSEISLPEGIPDLETWGRTICTLPKMADRENTYAELVQAAPTDPAVRSYLQYAKSHGHVSGKVKDLGDYLKMSRAVLSENCGQSSKLCYPGSNKERQFK